VTTSLGNDALASRLCGGIPKDETTIKDRVKLKHHFQDVSLKIGGRYKIGVR
jgi:hypothetical protein